MTIFEIAVSMALTTFCFVGMALIVGEIRAFFRKVSK